MRLCSVDSCVLVGAVPPPWAGQPPAAETFASRWWVHAAPASLDSRACTAQPKTECLSYQPRWPHERKKKAAKTRSARKLFYERVERVENGRRPQVVRGGAAGGRARETFCTIFGNRFWQIAHCCRKKFAIRPRACLFGMLTALLAARSFQEQPNRTRR